MRLLVIGAGGHAKVVIDAARLSGWDVIGVVGRPDDDTSILGLTVSHAPDDLDADCFIVAIGRNDVRARYYDEYRAAGYTPATVIHPTAIVSPTADIGCGTFIGAGAIVNVDAFVGENVILNTACVVDHDCFIGDHSLIGPTASLCGEVTVGMGVMFGAGANAIPGTTIGAWSVCGAGTVVVEDLAAEMVYVGVPAKPIRPIGTTR